MRAGSMVMLRARVPTMPRAIAGPVVRNRPTSATIIAALARMTVSADPAMTTPIFDEAMPIAVSESCPLRRSSW